MIPAAGAGRRDNNRDMEDWYKGVVWMGKEWGGEMSERVELWGMREGTKGAGSTQTKFGPHSVPREHTIRSTKVDSIRQPVSST